MQDTNKNVIHLTCQKYSFDFDMCLHIKLYMIQHRLLSQPVNQKAVPYGLRYNHHHCLCNIAQIVVLHLYYGLRATDLR